MGCCGSKDEEEDEGGGGGGANGGRELANERAPLLQSYDSPTARRKAGRVSVVGPPTQIQSTAPPSASIVPVDMQLHERITGMMPCEARAASDELCHSHRTASGCVMLSCCKRPCRVGHHIFLI